MFRLKSLGAADICGDNATAAGVAGLQSKRLALLAYLALARPSGGHRRDTLMALLWPELDQPSARNALRQAMHGIRKSLGADTLKSEGTEVVELNAAAISCDAWEFEQAFIDENYADALSLYCGDLLSGLFVHGAPAFEQWLDVERVRFREMVQKCAWARAEGARDRRELNDVSDAVRKALAFAPLDEGGVRRAMKMLHSIGERSTAVSLYREFERVLMRELEVQPSMETRAAFELLSDNRETAAVLLPPMSNSRDHAVRGLPIPLRANVASEPREQVALNANCARAHSLRRVAAALCAAAGTFIAVSASSMSGGGALDPRRVTVEMFANASGVAMLDTVAVDIGASVRDSLLGIDALALDASAARRDTRRTDTRSTRQPGTIVKGTLRQFGDSLEIRTQIVDVASNEVLRSNRFVEPMSRSAHLANVGAVADAVSASVASVLYPGWGRAIGQPPSLAAYRAFVSGLNDIKRERHDVAVRELRRAYEMDTTFVIGGLVASIEYYQMNQFRAADTMAQRIGKNASQLPPLERQLHLWITSSLRGDRVSARAAMSEVTRLAPTASLAWLQFAIDNVETDRPREALDAINHIAALNDFGDGWLSYWTTQLEALHLLGDHDRELQTARAALRAHPEFRVLAGYELRALAALGRTREVLARLSAGPSVLSTAGNDGSSQVRQVALELAAHGFRDASETILRGLLDWYASQPVAYQSTASARSGRARTLFLVGNNVEARALYDSLTLGRRDCVDCVGVVGVLAARMGNVQAANAASAQLESMDGQFRFARHILWRARIAGALGDYASASTLLTRAYAAGSEFDILTHADPDLLHVRADALYREYSFASEQ